MAVAAARPQALAALVVWFTDPTGKTSFTEMGEMGEVGSRLRTHDVELTGRKVVLRPMTENDWSFLRELNNDRQVLWYAEEDDTTSWNLPDLKRAYRNISRAALMFIVECEGAPVGECWLQEMNAPSILEKFAGLDLRRIDLALASRVWSRGIGTETIGLLTDFAFAVEHADGLGAVGVADYNVRSRRAFERNGYRLVSSRRGGPGAKAATYYDLVRWSGSRS